mgnify:CR=1 FL=1
MKHRLISLLLAVMLLLAVCLPASALNLIEDAAEDAVEAAEDAAEAAEDLLTGDDTDVSIKGQTFVMDFAGLLTADQQEALEAEAEDIAKEYGCGIYLLTVDSTGSETIRDFARSFFQENDLGLDTGKNGVLFTVSMEKRDCVTVTYGTGIEAFTDYGIELMEDDLVEELHDNHYNRAFLSYYSTSRSYLKQWEKGEPFDVGSKKSIFMRVLIVVFVPLIISLIVCMVFYGQMKNAKKATQADNYIPADGFTLTREVDQYTHTTTTRRRIERDSSSHGGSSVDSHGFGGSSGRKF